MHNESCGNLEESPGEKVGVYEHVIRGLERIVVGI